MPEVLPTTRTGLGMSQADLAAQVGVDKRQIRRYEAGETQPTLAAAKAIAQALGISIDDLAGHASHRVNLDGDWWAAWQTWKDGLEVVNPHQIRITQRGDALDIVATTRGTPLDEGGYLWRGEMRVWDNEAVMGWYAADEGAVRSKGTVYLALHPHGIHLTGRWVGMSYDGPLVSGWGVIARTEDEVVALMDQLRQEGTVKA